MIRRLALWYLSHPTPPFLNPRLMKSLSTILQTSAISRFGSGANYWETHGKRTTVPRLSQGCFGGLQYDKTRAVHFLAKINGVLVDEAYVRWWLRFMRHMFAGGPLRWTARAITVKNGGMDHRCIFYHLRTMSKNTRTSLVYLNAFRTVQNRYALANQLYGERTKFDNPDEAFRRFQELHYENWEGGEDLVRRKRWANDYNPGHKLSADRPISLDQFHANLRAGNKETVYAHFS